MKKEKQWRCFYEVWRATFWNWQEKKKSPSKGDKICQRNVVELMLEHKVSGRA